MKITITKAQLKAIMEAEQALSQQAQTHHPKAEEWIKCSDRLPQHGQLVLVGGYLAEEWISTTDRYLEPSFLKTVNFKITHWMSLPSPPKELTDETLDS